MTGCMTPFKKIMVIKKEQIMATYRTYKNGIYGRRYKGYYIEKHNDKDYSLIDKDKNVIKEHFSDPYDCEWEVEKILASRIDLKAMKGYYDLEIYQINMVLGELTDMQNVIRLSKYEEWLKEILYMIRSRKAADKPF